jgi:hypothetical protein
MTLHGLAFVVMPIKSRSLHCADRSSSDGSGGDDDVLERGSAAPVGMTRG